MLYPSKVARTPETKSPNAPPVAARGTRAPRVGTETGGLEGSRRLPRSSACRAVRPVGAAGPDLRASRRLVLAGRRHRDTDATVNPNITRRRLGTTRSRQPVRERRTSYGTREVKGVARCMCPVRSARWRSLPRGVMRDSPEGLSMTAAAAGRRSSATPPRPARAYGRQHPELGRIPHMPIARGAQPLQRAYRTGLSERQLPNRRLEAETAPNGGTARVLPEHRRHSA